jgi:hypothetical protein
MSRLLPLALFALACSAPQPSQPDAGGDLVPDFSLLDVNPASPRAGTQVSPRDYAGVVTGWYFGHST